jgi:hypothetical protein
LVDHIAASPSTFCEVKEELVSSFGGVSMDFLGELLSIVLASSAECSGFEIDNFSGVFTFAGELRPFGVFLILVDNMLPSDDESGGIRNQSFCDIKVVTT